LQFVGFLADQFEKGIVNGKQIIVDILIY